MALLTLFGWRELTITQDPVQLSRITAALEQAGLSYRVKTQNMGHSNRRDGLLGSLGEDPRYSVLYQLFVRKADLEQAAHLCASSRRREDPVRL